MMMQLRPVAGAHTRSATSRPRPFTAAVKPARRSVYARAADVPAAAAPAAEDPVAESLFEDDEQEQVERITLDAEARAALSIAEEVLATYPAESLLEASMQEGGAGAGIAARANAALEAGLESARGVLPAGLEVAVNIAAAGLEPEEIAEDEIEDWQSAAGFRKYDEEEQNSVLPAVQQQITPLKLTRQELANLVPQDWSEVNVEWFSSKKEENIPLPDYKLNFLYQDKNIAVAVDQVYSRGQTSPLTEYFVWPRKDAWEELKQALEARPWVSERDKIILLNRLTEVINFWQADPENKKPRPTVDQARSAFPDCAFA